MKLPLVAPLDIVFGMAIHSFFQTTKTDSFDLFSLKQKAKNKWSIRWRQPWVLLLQLFLAYGIWIISLHVSWFFFNSPGVPPDCEHHFYTFGTPKTETATSTPHPGRFMRELSEWHASRHDLPVEGDPNLGRCQVGEKGDCLSVTNVHTFSYQKQML